MLGNSKWYNGKKGRHQHFIAIPINNTARMRYMRCHPLHHIPILCLAFIITTHHHPYHLYDYESLLLASIPLRSASSNARCNRTCSGTRDDGPAVLMDVIRITLPGVPFSIMGLSVDEFSDGDELRALPLLLLLP